MEQLKIEKFATADRGNGLRAVAPLRPGELLFRSDPLAYTVCKGSRGVVCDRCLLGYVRRALPVHLNPGPCGVRGAGGLGLAGAAPASHAPRRARVPGRRRRVAPDRPGAQVPRAAARWGRRVCPGPNPASLQRGPTTHPALRSHRAGMRIRGAPEGALVPRQKVCVLCDKRHLGWWCKLTVPLGV